MQYQIPELLPYKLTENSVKSKNTTQKTNLTNEKFLIGNYLPRYKLHFFVIGSSNILWINCFFTKL